MAAIEERDEALLQDRIGGATLNQLGLRYGLSIEGARKAVFRTARRHVDKIELDLLAASKTGQWPTLLVPFQEQDGWQMALAYFTWIVGELRSRGVPVTVTTTQTTEGTAFQLRTEEIR